ncbi:MAG: thiamine phosphate synthase [Planctomycetota bacterium]
MPLLGKLYLLFSPERCRHDPLETLRVVVEAGVDIVQWRSSKPNRDLLMRARSFCAQQRVPFFINDDVMMALRAEADGAHVGQEDMPAHAARKLLFGRLLGVSTHDEKQIREAHAARADYVGFGPCHATETKGYTEGVGHDAIASAVAQCNELQLPMYAIGGITPENVPTLYGLGVRRIAVSSFLLQHETPGRATRELLAALP